MEHYLSGVAAHMGPTLAVFFAAFIQSITGFGLVIIAAPLLMFFYEPKLTVPVMLLLACSGNAAQGFLMRRQANFPLIRWMYLGMLVGQPIGFFFFTYISNDALKVFINVVVLATLLLMQISHRRIEECRRNTVITGMLSGFTAITTGMGGLPFLIYLAYSKMPPDVFRATCFVYFFSATPPRLSVISSAAFRSRRHSASLSISCPRSSSALSADGRACALFPRLSCANSSS